ncbi:MAG TPA: hypothetical protein PKH94_09015 [Bacteroidales bacterium]|nr:hypothetical protein [Bacteroidales bacterium]HNS47365.1 hypothetical protein [Bacteroidales bacterium]
MTAGYHCDIHTYTIRIEISYFLSSLSLSFSFHLTFYLGNRQWSFLPAPSHLPAFAGKSFPDSGKKVSGILTLTT